MSKYIITCATKYDFVNDKGEKVQGCKISYFDRKEDGSSIKGYPALNVNADVKIWDKLEEIPGLYDIDFKMVPGPKGRVTLVLNDIKYCSKVDIIEVS